MNEPGNVNQLTDQLFRQQSGKLISVLTRIFGTEHMETAEDVVQSTFVEALNTWKFKGTPDNPEAWLFRVAKNKAIDVIRKKKHSVDYDFNDPERILLNSEYTLVTTMEKLWEEDLVKDDTLRMMYACCHPEISIENQLTLILKSVCGLSVLEISKAFLSSEETITKRLYRTKEFFRKNKIRPEIPSVSEIRERTAAVLNAIYLLFNEGYNSSNKKELIRNDLIIEAMSLAKMLTENEHTKLPEVFALMALMCFHAARSESRVSPDGEIILLADQDRTLWNRELIELGNVYMNNSAFGNILTSYHIEAAISYEHCHATSFDTTNWEKILELYDLLLNTAPSPVAHLNKAAVIFHLSGPQDSLNYLENISAVKSLSNYYLYNSLMGEINSALGNHSKADEFYRKSILQTNSETEKRLLEQKRIRNSNG